VLEKFPKPEENSFEDDPSTGAALENEGERDTRREQDIARKIKTLETQAEVDPLTGLLNRRGFEARVRRAYEMLGEQRRGKDNEERTIIITIADVDNFKWINDTFGHDAGDEVLRRVAHCLRDKVRAVDAVGRWGGEEFVLALTNGPDLPAAKIAEELRGQIEKLDIDWKGQRIKVTVSFGVADGKDADTFDGAIHSADMALYMAKRGGRNQVARSSRIPEQAAA